MALYKALRQSDIPFKVGWILLANVKLVHARLIAGFKMQGNLAIQLQNIALNTLTLAAIFMYI